MQRFLAFCLLLLLWACRLLRSLLLRVTLSYLGDRGHYRPGPTLKREATLKPTRVRSGSLLYLLGAARCCTQSLMCTGIRNHAPRDISFALSSCLWPSLACISLRMSLANRSSRCAVLCACVVVSTCQTVREQDPDAHQDWPQLEDA